MREECGRIFGGRLIWLLFLGAVAVNLWIVWNFRENREYVEISRSLAESGVEVLTGERTEDVIGAFAGAEERQPGLVRVRNLVEGAVALPEQLHASDLAEIYVGAMKLEGEAAEWAREAYGALEPVMEQNRNDGTARQFFVPCCHGFFELYSRWIPLACTVETVLAAVLLMMKCVNEPFDRQTGAVVYATKTGRGVNGGKCRAVLAAAGAFAAGIWATAIGTAAMAFPMGRLWNVRLGSMMALDGFAPLIVRFPVSIWENLLLQFALCLCVAGVFGGLAYFAVLRAHRTFAAFGRMALVCFATAVLTSAYPRNTVLYFALRFNPVDFAAKAGRWFASGGSFLSVRWYEVGFVAVWGSLTAVLCHMRNRRFLREDL